jgi:phosphoribosyl 1,2-cyclic phosphodiesterase
MAFFFASLNSGSNGNCYCVGNENDIILIDGGISWKETEKRMLQIGLSIKKVKAVFVSHEHIDHVKGIEVLVKKYNIPVHVNEKTLKGAGNFIPKSAAQLFTSGETIQIGALLVHSFSKMHDAADPISFVVEHQGLRIGVMTDIGKPCDNVINHFKQCNAVLLESNYDSNMLDNGKYPYLLKKRISGDFGHLSNEQALDLFLTHKSKSLSHLMLGHLSQENNHPSIVQDLFTKNSVSTKISVASRQHPSEIIMVSENDNKKAAPNSMMQLDLFN